MAMYSAQTFMLCHDHIEWLTDMAVRHELREVEGHGDETDAVLQRLIDYCNSEPNERKRLIFKIVRCHRCSQASTGGKKVETVRMVRSEQYEWLCKVQNNCNHPTPDKTLRIMLDFYKSACRSYADLEDAIFDK